MPRPGILLVALVIVLGVVTFAVSSHRAAAPTTTHLSPASTIVVNQDNVNPTVPIVNATTPMTVAINTTITPPLAPTVVVPITDFFNRITKKPFGIHITPATSPVQPEKFSGYHTGADAETTAAEKSIDVPIYAIANGTVVFVGHVNGYGGVVIIRHLVDGQTVTALYGHVRQSSIAIKVGKSVTMGQKIAVLGKGYSSETDGERKHLHLGIVKGATINYKGYVQTKSALSAWEDPVAWLNARLAA